MFFGTRDDPCGDCTQIGGKGRFYCTMNCGPSLRPHGSPPNRIWLIFPDDGGAPVLWTTPCPFPVDDGTVVAYQMENE